VNNLIFKRKKRPPVEATGQVVIKINAVAYNKVLEVADETGESLRSIVSKMVEFAYENVSYESGEEE
jgi:dsDNA-binding SOS-regulon protein